MPCQPILYVQLPFKFSTSTGPSLTVYAENKCLNEVAEIPVKWFCPECPIHDTDPSVIPTSFLWL